MAGTKLLPNENAASSLISEPPSDNNIQWDFNHPISVKKHKLRHIHLLSVPLLVTAIFLNLGYNIVGSVNS